LQEALIRNNKAGAKEITVLFIILYSKNKGEESFSCLHPETGNITRL
jgi:hypothetical protein